MQVCRVYFIYMLAIYFSILHLLLFCAHGVRRKFQFSYWDYGRISTKHFLSSSPLQFIYLEKIVVTAFNKSIYILFSLTVAAMLKPGKSGKTSWLLNASIELILQLIVDPDLHPDLHNIITHNITFFDDFFSYIIENTQKSNWKTFIETEFRLLFVRNLVDMMKYFENYMFSYIIAI